MRSQTVSKYALVVAGLLLAACGGDDTPAATTAPKSPTDPSTTSTASTTPPSTDESDLPGDPIDVYPYAETPLSVVSISHDDVLHIRSGPGTSFAVVADLDPLETGLVATGRNRSLPDSIWAEVSFEKHTGWVNTKFVAQIRTSRDRINSVADEAITAETLLQLATRVANEIIPTESGEELNYTVASNPDSEDDVTIDVVTFHDDAIKGERIKVTGEIVGDRWRLVSVSGQDMCLRGIAEDLCL